MTWRESYFLKNLEKIWQKHWDSLDPEERYPEELERELFMQFAWKKRKMLRRKDDEDWARIRRREEYKIARLKEEIVKIFSKRTMLFVGQSKDPLASLVKNVRAAIARHKRRRISRVRRFLCAEILFWGDRFLIERWSEGEIGREMLGTCKCIWDP
jgi:hypothetical protein